MEIFLKLFNGHHVTRRGFLKTMMIGSVGAFLGAKIEEATGRTLTAPSEAVPPLPWPYVKLDPVEVAERAYVGYWKVCCCYGVAESIIGSLQDKIGFPYTTIPTMMFHFGCGGMHHWGYLCGALAAASVVTHIIAGNPDKAVSEKTAWPIATDVYRYFENESIPDPNFIPKAPRYPEVKVRSIVPGNTLCHSYVMKICNLQKCDPGDPPRKETCARLAASVAMKLTEYLNMWADQRFKPVYSKPASAVGCLKCHSAGGVSSYRGWGEWDCTQCHKQAWKHP
ncbi:MAG: C-GCAxxG-C-C family protein [Armatimonadota bacterium]|nr:C-GCAxxG-C-C family protein [Armatimonadota bacterium]MDR5702326.1 C-GCAxxG-C-C family protein [Armatimonadota bacterium]